MLCALYRHIVRFFSAKCTYLLLSLILLFVFRPSGEELIYLAFWEFCFVAVFAGAIFNCNHSFKIKLWAAVIGVPALLLEWITIHHPIAFITVISICLTILFLAMCTL